jgi:hypothetical protein
MAINKVIYGSNTIIDLTGLTVTPETLLEGTIGINAKGERIVGTAKAAPPISVVILYGMPNEVISYNGMESGSVTRDSSGVGSVTIGGGFYVFTGGTSGITKSVTIRGNTTVGIWPEGATAYFWNGWQLNGGWTNAGYSEGHLYQDNVFAGIEDNQIRVMANTNYRGATMGTVNTVDLTNIRTLYFELTECSHASYVNMGVTLTPGDVNSTGAQTKPTTTGASTVSLDVSGLSGNYYLYVYAWRYNYYYANAKFSRIWGVA